MKYITTSHYVNDKNKDGKPFLTKDGKPFKKVSIKVNKIDGDPKEYDDQYISSLVFKDDGRSLFWKVGDEVDIIIEKNGEFWNFRQPIRQPSRLDLLENRVKALEDFLKGDLPVEDKEEDKNETDEYTDVITANNDDFTEDNFEDFTETEDNNNKDIPF
jgi:hypothetical protein